MIDVNSTPMTEREIKSLHKLLRRFQYLRKPPSQTSPMQRETPEVEDYNPVEAIGVIALVAKWVEWYANEQSIEL